MYVGRFLDLYLSLYVNYELMLGWLKWGMLLESINWVGWWLKFFVCMDWMR